MICHHALKTDQSHFVADPASWQPHLRCGSWEADNYLPGVVMTSAFSFSARCHNALPCMMYLYSLELLEA